MKQNIDVLLGLQWGDEGKGKTNFVKKRPLPTGWQTACTPPPWVTALSRTNGLKPSKLFEGISKNSSHTESTESFPSYVTKNLPQRVHYARDFLLNLPKNLLVARRALNI